MSPAAILLCQILWVALVAAVLLFNGLGVAARHAELMVPFPPDGDPAIGQYLAEEHAALADVGISVSGLVTYLEGLSGAVTLACLVFGGLIYWRRRDSLVAFVASLFLLLTSVAMTQNIDALARANPAYEPFAIVFQALASTSVLLLLLLFPNGRFTTRWMRWALVPWVSIYAWRLIFPHPPWAPDLWSTESVSLLTLPFYLVGLALQVRRFRSTSTPEERQQTKWIVVALAALVAIHALIVVTVYVVPELRGTHRLFEHTLLGVAYNVAFFHVFVLAIALTPLAFLFAILRYRLWDIDFIINRSLVYGSLTVGLVAFFAGCVFGVRQLMLVITDGEQLWVALSVAMLAVGLAFGPARRFVHDWVNRRIYGIEIDPQAPPATVQLQRGEPHSLPGYQDLTHIGSGGMADVYRAFDIAKRRPVAIKIMHDALIDEDPIFVHRFEREARIVQGLRHDNIVGLFDHGVTDEGTRYMVLEYIAGTDLRTHLQRNDRLTVDQALPILRDLSEALDYAHGEGVIHRDLKPSNVLLDLSEGGPDQPHRAVLSDFGIAKLVSARSQLTATNLVGTIDYISPEQINDAADVDGRADIYSVGVLTYQLLTGRRPFEKNNHVAMMLAHLQQPPLDPRILVPDMPAAAAEGVLRAMAKRPEDRFATLSEMVEAMGAS